MDTLYRYCQPLLETWRGLSSGGRAMLSGAAAVMLVSAFFLLNGHAGGGQVELMAGQNFSAGQLRDMEAAFGKAGLSGYQVDGPRIKVPRGQQSKFMAALAEAGALPRDFGDFMQQAVSASGLLTNRAQQEAIKKVARQKDMQDIINEMRNVERSAVHIDQQTKDGFPPTSIITASVSILPKNNQPLDENLVSGIRHLVAASVAGLKPEAVTVVDLNTGQPFPGTAGASAGTLLGDYAELKRYYEREYQRNISQVLGYIPGVLVTTNVELDAEILNEEHSTKYDDRSVVYETREITRPLDPAAVRTPGASKSGSPDGKNSHDMIQTNQRKAVPVTQRKIVREGRTPKRVSASVAVPNTFYERIWRQLHPPQPGQRISGPDADGLADIQSVEKQKIEDLVAPLLPKLDPSASGPTQLAVTTFYQFPEPAPLEPTIHDTALHWLTQHGTTLGLAMIALVGLVVVRSIVKNAAAASVARASGRGVDVTISSPDHAAAKDHPPAVAARDGLKRPTHRGPSLQDELSEIVRDDPASAVSILRNWIGNAS